METCGGTPLDGGNPRGGNGSTYTTWWFPGGATGSSAPGETAAEFFPGTYSFQMQYQATADEKISVTIPDADTLLTWQTTNVALNYSGPISYGGSGDSRFFNKPSMELLPGTYTFNFRNGGGYTDLTFAGCTYESSIVVLKLLDSSNNGLDGGFFKYRVGWDPYTDIGTTDGTGTIIYPIDGLLTNTKFNVTYMGASLEKQQNIATDSFVVFNTVPVTAALNDSGGSPLGGATYEYRYGWEPKQPFTGPMELLPVNTRITVTYMGASVEKTQNANTNPDFVFATVPVTAMLNDSGGSSLGGAAFEYRYEWEPKQPFTGPMELLPVNTRITVTYMGASVEKTQNTNTNPNFVFATVPVTAALNDSGGSSLGGATFEYRYEWEPKQPFTGPMELLPVNTRITVSYMGTNVEKTQNTNTNPNFVFQTGSVTSATCTKYRYGYGSYMTYTSPMELLAVSTKFSDADGPDTSATPSSGGTITVTCP
jgi:hypothetical protein